MPVAPEGLRGLTTTTLKDLPDGDEVFRESLLNSQYHQINGWFPLSLKRTRWQKIKWKIYGKPLDYCRFMWYSIREAHREY